jgi:hypothetical protein
MSEATKVVFGCSNVDEVAGVRERKRWGRLSAPQNLGDLGSKVDDESGSKVDDGSGSRVNDGPGSVM